MEYTTLHAWIPGTHVSGIDVSMEPCSWQRKRALRALNDFPTNGTGVSAGGCRT